MPAPTGRSAAPRPHVEPLSSEDRDSIIDLDQWAFGQNGDDLDPATLAEAFEWDRAFGIHAPDTGELTATNLTLSVTLTVPGGEIPCAGLTWVAVHPQHRRQGFLRAMIDHHLHAVRRRGEPASALYAAEAGIYGRFGYGLATRGLRLTVPRGAGLRDVPDWRDVRVRLERVDPERHADLVAACHDAARLTRPGMVSRPSLGLRRHHLSDQAALRRGGESLRIALADTGPDGGQRPVRGYALFRRHHGWNDAGIADGTVRVRECIALDAAAHRALWGRLLDLDLTARVETWDQAVDDPLVHLLADVRSAAPRVSDALWLRIVDVPAALAGRRYAREIDAVVAVTDELCPWNTGHWHLRGGPDGATCAPTSAAPDLQLDVRELGAAYLGGESLAALAAGGLVAGQSASVLTAATAFGWPLAPFNSWMF